MKSDQGIENPQCTPNDTTLCLLERRFRVEENSAFFVEGNFQTCSKETSDTIDATNLATRSEHIRG